MIKKADLPQKLCPVCDRPFIWRKKWQKVWAEVKYCSKRCQKSKNKKVKSDGILANSFLFKPLFTVYLELKTIN